MEKTSRILLSLLVLSGGVLSACAPKEEPVVSTSVPTENTDSTTPEEPAKPAEETAKPVEEAKTPTEDNTSADAPVTSAPLSLYVDGTYQSNGTYNSPAGVDSLGVSLTIKNDVVTAVNVSVLATNEGSIYFQNLFADSIADFVVGKSLEDLTGVSVVNGSSLTPIGFNQALANIKAEALR